MNPGSIVLLHLVDPTEKYWGALRTMASTGVTLRGVNISSFDDWIAAVAYEDPPSLGPATVFFPMRRIESMFLDERIGMVESYAERCERRTGVRPEVLLAPESEPGGDQNST